ncbi:MAG TPA: hypothetical protein VGT41_05690 [Candidatus Babeliales bacterium]|nr:hypothetical protein [Candidatus Babeliales bacterium]
MLKKTLIPLLLVAFQLQAAPKDTAPKLTPEEISKITRVAKSCGFNSNCCNSCKCFSCIKAVCAMIDTLVVNGNLDVGGDVTIAGTLTVNGVPVSDVAATYGRFYALMPADNPAPIVGGQDVAFPQIAGDLNNVITRFSSTQFILPVAGIYEVTWQVSPSTQGQLVVALNNVEQPETVVGRFDTESQIVGSTFIQTTGVNTILSIRNPAGNADISLAPDAGDTDLDTPVSATLTIKRVA